MEQSNRQSDLLTTAEAAAVLGRSERTITRWVKDGKLPALKRLGALLFRRTDVEALLTAVPVQVPPSQSEEARAATRTFYIALDPVSHRWYRRDRLVEGPLGSKWFHTAEEARSEVPDGYEIHRCDVEITRVTTSPTERGGLLS